MKVNLSEPAGFALLNVATSIGISAEQLMDQLIEDASARARRPMGARFCLN
jgi:hypothetical protein